MPLNSMAVPTLFQGLQIFHAIILATKEGESTAIEINLLYSNVTSICLCMEGMKVCAAYWFWKQAAQWCRMPLSRERGRMSFNISFWCCVSRQKAFRQSCTSRRDSRSFLRGLNVVNKHDWKKPPDRNDSLAT